jgi:hypothetical protein
LFEFSPGGKWTRLRRVLSASRSVVKSVLLRSKEMQMVARINRQILLKSQPAARLSIYRPAAGGMPVWELAARSDQSE